MNFQRDISNTILSSCKTEQSICTQVWPTNTSIFHCKFPGKHSHPAACHQPSVMLHFRGIKYPGKKQYNKVACTTLHLPTMSTRDNM